MTDRPAKPNVENNATAPTPCGAGPSTGHPAQGREPPDALGVEYRATLDALFDAVHVVDTELRIVLINQSFIGWLDRLGIGSDVIGRTVLEVFPFLSEQVREEYEHVIDQGVSLVTRDSVPIRGALLHTETRKIPVMAGERVVRVVTVVRDVTDLDRASTALRQSEENYRRLVEVAPVGLAVHQNDHIVFANRAALDIVGASQAVQVVGRPVLDFVHPTFLEQVRSRVEQLGPASPMPPTEERFMRVDGTTVDVLVVGSVFTFRGEPAVQVVFQDISEQKAAAEQRRRLHGQVERAQRLESVGALAGGIAHDFNNLLTAILGRVELARIQLPDGATRTLLLEAENAGEQAVALTRQLLTFAKGGTPVREAAPLGTLARETTEFCVRGRPVDAQFDLADERLANIDVGQLRQVVQNLVLNAIDAMPHGGRIHLATADVSRDGRSWVELRLTDTGPGIASEVQERVFEPYYTTKPAGSGLGLSVVHSIVQQHGGQLRLASRPGEGTTVRVLVPAASATRSNVPVGPSMIPATGLDVLVMDDDPSIRSVVSDMMQTCGHRVTTVAEGQLAIDAYRAAYEEGRPFDVVILDLTVRRGMGGRDAARELLAFDERATLVVSSGYSDDPVLAQSANYGFAATLPKPFTLAQLLDTLATVLRRRPSTPPEPPPTAPSGSKP